MEIGQEADQELIKTSTLTIDTTLTITTTITKTTTTIVLTTAILNQVSLTLT